MQSSGALCLVGALLHLAIPVGGSSWFAFFGAPSGLIAMLEAGSLRPLFSCVLIAAFLLAISIYAFSAAGSIRRLPYDRGVLGIVGSGLLLRGVLFVPIAALRPELLSGICGRCDGITPFLLTTSVACLCVGGIFVAYAVRARI